MEEFKTEVAAYTSEDMCLLTDFSLINNIYVARSPMWVVRLDTQTGVYTFTDMNTSTTSRGFNLAAIVPTYLR